MTVYWATSRHEFVALDDPVYVSDNSEVRAGLSWKGILWTFSHVRSSNWHPLTWISHMLDCSLFGLNAGMHHLESAVIHAVNTLLLFLFLNRVTKAFWRSTFVAALFALHPLHVESVAWISERKDVLSTFFFLLTLLSYGAYVSRADARSASERLSCSKRHASYFYCLTILSFVLGLLSKPMLVTLPGVLLLLDYWPLQRFQFRNTQLEAARPTVPMRFLFMEKLPFVIISIASCCITLWAQWSGKAIATLEKLPIGHRIINSLVAYSSYIEKLCWPTDLAVFYPFPHEPQYGVALVSSFVLLAISVLAIAWRASRPFFLMGWLWYLGTLLPVIGIVQVGSQGMADRYSYIPSIGLFLALSWLVSDLAASLKATTNGGLKRWRLRSQLVLAGAALTVVAICAVLTWTQVKTWRNTRTLFEHAAKVTKNNFMAYTALGRLLVIEHKNEQAIDYFKKAIEYMPNSPGAWFGIGAALYDIGKHSAGLECAKKGLQLDPNSPEGLRGYAVMLLKEQNLPEAESLLRQAIELKPNYAEAYLDLAIVLNENGAWEQAVVYFERAIQLKPEAEDMRLGFADALYKRKKFDQAADQYKAILAAQPRLKQAELGLATILVAQRRFEEASVLYLAMLASCPTNAQALDGLGYTLVMRKKAEEAFACFSKATALDPNNGFAQLHLAMELDKRGKANEAIAHYRMAILAEQNLDLAMNNLAWRLATDPSAEIRNGREAIELADRACRMSRWREPFFIGTLAAAYAENGCFEDATKTAERAFTLAQSLGMTEVAERNLSLLELYRSGKPYRNDHGN